MNRCFYFLVYVCFFTFLPQLALGMEDEQDSGSRVSPILLPIGLIKEPDGRARIIYDFVEGKFDCGPVTTIQEALAQLPNGPIHQSFAAQFIAYENRIESLKKEGQAFVDRRKSENNKENNAVTLFCEDFGLDKAEAIQKFGIPKLMRFVGIYLKGLDEMHRDYQKNLIPKLNDKQSDLSATLFDLVKQFPEGVSEENFLQEQAKSYAVQISNFIDELRAFSIDMKAMKKNLGIGENALDGETLKYTTYYRYRIGNLILQHNLLRIIRDVVAPFLEKHPGWKDHFYFIPESDFDQYLSDRLFPQQPNLVKEEDKGRKGRNRRQVNKRNKVKALRKENVPDTADLAPLRGLSLYEVFKAPDLEETPSFPSASPLPPGGYKSQYRQIGEATKIKTHKVSEEKEKETCNSPQASKDTSSAQDIFYAENPEVLGRLLRCEKVEFNEYLNLLKDLVASNSTVLEKVEFTGQHGSHPVYKLSFRDQSHYTWEISQAHGGRFIPQNHTYRKSYRKPFKRLGILETGLKDIQDKKCEVEKECESTKENEVEKGYEPKEKTKEGEKSKNRRKRHRKKKGNNTPIDQNSNLKKEEPGVEKPSS